MIKCRRFLTLFLAVLFICSALTVPASAIFSSFSDVTATNDTSLMKAVEFLYGLGIVNGKSSSQFKPDDTLTRAEMVTMLWRMAGKPETGSIKFSDCKNTNAYYYKAVKWAGSAWVSGLNTYIAAGTGATSFNPDRKVTNQEALTFLYRFAVYYGYVDNPKSSGSGYGTYASWANPAAAWAIKSSVISQEKYYPGNSDCTRGGIAKALFNFYKTYQKKYALIGYNAQTLPTAPDTREAMRVLFKKYGADTVRVADFENTNLTAFYNEMKSAFSGAKPIDICYVGIVSHGIPYKGAALFSKDRKIEDRLEEKFCLLPKDLVTEIDKYNGTFAVFVSSCYSGIYCNYLEQHHNTDKIKVLCSSSLFDESKGVNVECAVTHWCAGSGYDSRSLNNSSYNSSCPAYADTSTGIFGNNDGMVSMAELFYYSFNKCGSMQTPSCYPAKDSAGLKLIVSDIGW